jgi:hypothetical protein
MIDNRFERGVHQLGLKNQTRHDSDDRPFDQAKFEQQTKHDDQKKNCNVNPEITLRFKRVRDALERKTKRIGEMGSTHDKKSGRTFCSTRYSIKHVLVLAYHFLGVGVSVGLRRFVTGAGVAIDAARIVVAHRKPLASTQPLMPLPLSPNAQKPPNDLAVTLKRSPRKTTPNVLALRKKLARISKPRGAETLHDIPAVGVGNAVAVGATVCVGCGCGCGCDCDGAGTSVGLGVGGGGWGVAVGTGGGSVGAGGGSVGAGGGEVGAGGGSVGAGGGEVGAGGGSVGAGGGSVGAGGGEVGAGGGSVGAGGGSVGAGGGSVGAGGGSVGAG